MTYTNKKSKVDYHYKIKDTLIQPTDTYKDLGVMFQSNLSFDKQIKDVTQRAYKKLGMIIRHCQSITDIDAILLLYLSIVRSTLEYGSVVWSPNTQCLLMNKKGALRKLELKDRKMLRKILGPINDNGEYCRRHNHELYEQIEDLVTCMRKRRMLFFGHLERMLPNRLSHQIHVSLAKKTSYSKWADLVKKDLEEAHISPEDICNRDTFRDLVKTATLQPLTTATARPASRWSQQRKNAQSQRMKEYWQRRKARES
ncbi:hypothetical protein WDU94_001932 [Cyamophila willieti]